VVLGPGMGTRESPKVDGMIAGAAQFIASKCEVRHVGEKAGSHFDHARLATIDDDPPVLRIELCDGLRRSGVSGRRIGLGDCLNLAVIDRHWVPTVTRVRQCVRLNGPAALV
jgi:hypothetical protein